MTVSRDERSALADLLLSIGPEAPTLCAGWTTRDLAVHLVVREYRPDAAAGMFFHPIEPHLESVTEEYFARPYSDLVAAYRSGPPKWSPMRLVDPLVNLSENFIHHEDVRRGGAEWSPRSLPESTSDALWRAVKLSSRGFILPVGPTVRLIRTDGEGGEVVIGRGTPDVVISGDAQEILLWVFGRDKACNLTIGGPIEDVVRRAL